MEKRDFFIVLIKIFGLYSIIQVLFSVLPNNIIFVITNIDFVGVVWIIATFLVVIGLWIILITKADKICAFLKLEKGFDEQRIDFGSLKSLDIIKIVVLIIGGFLLIENIPPLLSHTLFAFKSSVPRNLGKSLLKYNRLEDYVRWVTRGVNVLVGYLLIVNFKGISNFINKKVKS